MPATARRPVEDRRSRTDRHSGVDTFSPEFCRLNNNTILTQLLNSQQCLLYGGVHNFLRQIMAIVNQLIMMVNNSYNQYY